MSYTSYEKVMHNEASRSWAFLKINEGCFENKCNLCGVMGGFVLVSVVI